MRSTLFSEGVAYPTNLLIREVLRVAGCNKRTGSVECYEASSLSMLSVLSMELFRGMFWSYSTNRGLRPPTDTLLSGLGAVPPCSPTGLPCQFMRRTTPHNPTTLYGGVHQKFLHPLKTTQTPQNATTTIPASPK
jgi:hypothetical protein